MRSEASVYLGAGIALLSLLLATGLGIVSAARRDHQGFRYGAFIIPFAIVFGLGYYISGSVLLFHYVGGATALSVTVVFALAAVTLVVAALMFRFRSRAMLITQSVPFILCWPLTPIAVWNVVYAVRVVKRADSKGEVPLNHPPEATPEHRPPEMPSPSSGAPQL